MKVEKWMVIGILICFIGPVVFEGAYAYGAEGGKQSSSGGSKSKSKSGNTNGGSKSKGGDTNGGSNSSSSSDSGGGGTSTAKQSFGQRIKAGVQRVVNTVKAGYNKAKAAVSKGINKAKEYIANKKAEREAKRQGDPVLITTGQYLLEETDIEISGSSFTISREYVTGETVVGSFGRGWSTGLDSRIIRGKTAVPVEELKEIRGALGKLEVVLEEVKGAAGTEEAGLDAVKGLLEDGGEGGADEVTAEEWETIPAEERAAIVGAAGTELEEAKEEGEAGYRELQGIAEEAEGIHALNKLVLYAGSPEDYENLGNGSLIVISGRGTPIGFEAAGVGEWVPVDEANRLSMKLRSRDGKGVDTVAGFILYERGGVRRYYNGEGLLEAVEELNGERVELVRDGSGRVVTVKGPHKMEWEVRYGRTSGLVEGIGGPEGQEVKYRYEGNVLVGVRDGDGDEVGYVYEDGRLRKVGKGDGSYIELTYGAEREGEKLVTATRHEEGGVERFEYYAGYTVYTNHSGVVTKHWYNERLR
jgi:hypothetical protein